MRCMRNDILSRILYNRLYDQKIATMFKWIFALLQYIIREVLYCCSDEKNEEGFLDQVMKKVKKGFWIRH